MSRDDLLLLDDIRAACEKILRYTIGATYETFSTDDKTLDIYVPNPHYSRHFELARNLLSPKRQKQIPHIRSE